ncbi:hypothetical protein [Bradyrhizobium yuanmingense]|uniref:hypothetical protein n=1 Tax=Bradyrhizobium yuanmingense TaxID=108015 RepID=UPI0012FC7E19|nr:hypothetical protein [Bradyrhizobium yuanmingense]
MNDYNDPEAGLDFPRLQARIQPQKDGTCWIQLWLRKELGDERETIFNKKIGGSWRDAYEMMFEEAKRRNVTIEPDDIEVLPR